MDSYIKLGIVAVLPVLVSVFFELADRKTALGKMQERQKQILWGIAFGLLAILGTEWSIPINGAVLNCRDAAVITAGLFFGTPAGILAGVIGGAERWIAVAWGVGYYTRVACSVSTLLAGVLAGLLRKYMFEDKRPGFMMSTAIAIVMEVVHLNMVFLTNMNSPNEAMEIIRVCAVPLILANGLSVLASAVVLTLLSGGEFSRFVSGKKANISLTIQRWLMVTILTAFAATSFFVYKLQDRMAEVQGDKLLTMALDDTEADIRDASNENLLEIAYRFVREMKTESEDLDLMAQRYGIAEINIVNAEGVITDSTEDAYIGYDMHAGEQSKDFLCLLEGQESYVQDYGPISIDSSISRKYAGIRYGDGFIQVGYDAIQFQQDIDQDIIGITRNRHVGETGFILIIDEQFNVISAPKDMKMSTIKEDVDGAELPDEDVTFRGSLEGMNCWVRYRSAEGFHIVSILPEEEVMHVRNVALYVNSFMEVILFAVLFGLIYYLIAHVVVAQIKRINVSLAKITEGNLDEVVNVRTSEEFDILSDDINGTVNTLKKYIDEASKRIDQELELAKNIQRSALPGVFPAFPKRKDVDIYATMDPAREVGGDFYDFYMTKQDTLNVLIADVSGKGIPAAMFMMRAKAELKSLTEAEMKLSDVFTHGNEKLCEGNDAGMFVTVWQGCIDLTTGLVQYANAGHNPPLVRHEGGTFEYVKTRPGFVMAGMEGIRYRTQKLTLTPGDILYLYTDGVTEAMNEAEELYGNERLRETLNRVEFEDMQALCRLVKADVDAFVGKAEQFDDITMLAFRYVGRKVPSIRFEEAKISDIPAATEFVEGELEKLNCPMKAVMQISIAIDELFSNIVRYGYTDHSGSISVEVLEQEEPRGVCIRFRDDGIPYNPLTAAEPDTTLSAEERSIGGLGIFMVKKTMDEVNYQYENGQNILTIRKNF